MVVPKELAKFGLDTPQTPKRRRLILASYGKTAVGKSDFALRTMPRPLLIINLDRNIEALEEKYLEQDVLLKTVRLPRRIEKDADNELWKEVHELYRTAIEKDLVKSVMIDTFDGLYDLVRRAKLGTLEFGEAPRSAFSVVNSNMKWVYSVAKDSRVNLYLPHKVKKEFKEGVNANTGKKTGVDTGNLIRAGWGDAEYEAQMVVRLYKDPAESGEDRFKCEIIKCTSRPELESEGHEQHVLAGEEITFQMLGMLAFYPHTKRSDWL